MSAIIIDTETTGLHEPRPVQICWSDIEVPAHVLDPNHRPTLTTQLYNPGKPIELPAMATHLIHDEDVINAPPYTDFRLPDGAVCLIGHNVDFDWKVLGEPKVRRICTLALARRIWPDLPSHKLTVLLYFAAGAAEARRMVRHAHDAGNDVAMLLIVLRRMLAEPFLADCPTWRDVWVKSEQARIPERIDFGKHGPKPEEGRTHGMLISEMRRADPSYVQWLLSGKCDQVNNDPYLRKALTQ
jgi:exodeoxyribonuclease X